MAGRKADRRLEGKAFFHRAAHRLQQAGHAATVHTDDLAPVVPLGERAVAVAAHGDKTPSGGIQTGEQGDNRVGALLPAGDIGVTTHLAPFPPLLEMPPHVGRAELGHRQDRPLLDLEELLDTALVGSHMDVQLPYLAADETTKPDLAGKPDDFLCRRAGTAVVADGELAADDRPTEDQVVRNVPRQGRRGELVGSGQTMGGHSVVG